MDTGKCKVAREAHFTIWSNGRADQIAFTCTKCFQFLGVLLQKLFFFSLLFTSLSENGSIEN